MAGKKESKLTDKQQRFVDEYFVDSCQTQAAIRAGYSPKTAQQIASKLMATSRVKAEVDKRRAELSRRTGISAERVLQEYARLAFAKMSDVVTWSGDGSISMIPSGELTDDDAACIAEINETETLIPSKNGDPITKIQRSIKLHPKGPALDKLAQHLGLCKEDKKKVEVDLSDQLLKVLTGAWENGEK